MTKHECRHTFGFYFYFLVSVYPMNRTVNEFTSYLVIFEFGKFDLDGFMIRHKKIWTFVTPAKTPKPRSYQSCHPSKLLLVKWIETWIFGSEASTKIEVMRTLPSYLCTKLFLPQRSPLGWKGNLGFPFNLVELTKSCSFYLHRYVLIKLKLWW